MAAPLPYFLSPAVEEVQSLRRNWYWFLLLGILLIVVGMVAIAYPFVATITTVQVLGFLMLFAGVMEIVSGIWTRRWRGFFVHLLCGLLYLFAGLVFVERPIGMGFVLTLMLAVFFFAGGIIRIVVAVAERFSGWGWTLLSGVISVVLGVMIWQDIPESTLWLIGTFVGIDLIFIGWSWVMLGLGVKSIPEAKPAGRNRTGEVRNSLGPRPC
jgi:uncharacterized membrane protein HdeD (DUF308 family)